MDFLAGRASERKTRLLAVACCRRAWGRFVPASEIQSAIQIAEMYADSDVLRSSLANCRDHIQAGRYFEGRELWLASAARAACATGRVDAPSVSEAVANGSHTRPRGAEAEADRASERAAHARLARDVFGNPFRPVAVDPTRVTPVAVSLGRAAYDERLLPSGELDRVRLCVLADALEEAGAEEELLSHLRGPGPHVRGCWVVDLILGKW
jgi:hypothetical protein